MKFSFALFYWNTKLTKWNITISDRDSIERNRGQMPSISCVEDVLEVIQDDYRQAYFLTGNGFYIKHIINFQIAPGI